MHSGLPFPIITILLALFGILLLSVLFQSHKTVGPIRKTAIMRREVVGNASKDEVVACLLHLGNFGAEVGGFLC